jgi:hypothetical protein
MFLIRAVVLLGAGRATVWAAGALHFDFPFAGSVFAALYAVSSVVLLALAWRRLWAAAAWVLLFAAVTLWWFSLKPTNDADWQPNVARTAWAEIEGERVTIHDVRNCDYRTEQDYTPRWETRTYDLARLQHADLFLTHWGSPYIAHPIISFDFGGADHVCFSVETRMRKGQSYSAIEGFYRRFGLIYVAADERDVIRLRTNYRKDEEVRLYRLTLSPEAVRVLWTGYVRHLNQLHETPAWYNAITENCTTSVRRDVVATLGHPVLRWNWRILANGYLDQMLYQDGFIAGDLPFPELAEKANINKAAQAANDSPDFSALIRIGRPGFR